MFDLKSNTIIISDRDPWHWLEYSITPIPTDSDCYDHMNSMEGVPVKAVAKILRWGHHHIAMEPLGISGHDW